jgi:hypothetical protein
MCRRILPYILNQSKVDAVRFCVARPAQAAMLSVRLNKGVDDGNCKNDALPVGFCFDLIGEWLCGC